MKSFIKTSLMLAAASLPSAFGAIGDPCSQSVLGTVTHGKCQQVSKCASGATVQNLCPHDPSDVRCCFDDYPCELDMFPGVCQDVTKSTCGGNRYFKGLCPGPDNTQCCLTSDTTVDHFVNFLKDTYTLATQYLSGKNPKTNANELVMQWLRHENYNDFAWRRLIGGVDDDWVNFAKGKNHPMFDVFVDPSFCDQKTETDHLGATMDTIYHYPPLGYPYVNRGDFGGWGGDLVTLYANWWQDGTPAARAYVKEKILGDNSSFKLLDAIEDADGYNLAVQLKADPSLTIYDAAAAYYKPSAGYRDRFAQLYKSRFSGDREHTLTLAHEILTAPFYIDPSKEDAVPYLIRIAAVEKTAGKLTKMPAALTDAELKPFLDGFADAMEALVALKGRKCD